MASEDPPTQPAFGNRFRAIRAKEIIGEVLKEKLTGAVYHADNTGQWAREISDDIKRLIKDENWQRYKIIVQVVIGEQRGEGVNMAARCFWDAHADDHAMDTFKNESIFCVAAAFGAYFP